MSVIMLSGFSLRLLDMLESLGHVDQSLAEGGGFRIYIDTSVASIIDGAIV